MMKLLYGDCLEYMDILDNNIKFNAIITDPPYEILNKKCNWDKMIPIEPMWERLEKLSNDNTPIILFSAEPYTSMLVQSRPNLFKYKIYWEKTHATGHLNAKKQPMRCIEEILVFYKKQCVFNPQKTKGHKAANINVKKIDTQNKTLLYGNATKEVICGGNTDRYPRNLLKFSSDKQTSCLHPTQKPLELMKNLVSTYTNKGDLVLDFTMGSGTTGLACKLLDREFIGIENNPKYFDIAYKRINNEQLKKVG